MKEKLLKFLKADHIYSGFIGGLVLAILIILYCCLFSKEIPTEENILNGPTVVNEDVYNSLVNDLNQITPIELASMIYTNEIDRYSEESSFYSVLTNFRGEDVISNDEHFCIFSLYYINAGYDGFTTYNLEKQYIINKMDTFYDVEIQYYAVDGNNKRISEDHKTFCLQYGFDNGKVQFTTE